MAKELKPQRNPYKFQYAAKFICTANIPGASQATHAFVPGSYQTVINIHNRQNNPIKLRKKIASPIEILQYFETAMKPEAVERTTCAQTGEFGVHLIYGCGGFLVIESTHNLDVVAVYPAAGNQGHVSSMDVEQIKERKL